jgi:hypothetical protein
MRLPQPTVRSHLRRVFCQLGVQSRVELAPVIEQGAVRADTMAAVDDTGRLIERDLHDGLQQRLVALGLRVRGRGFGLGRHAVLKRGTPADGGGPADSGWRILQVRRTWSVRQPPGLRLHREDQLA